MLAVIKVNDLGKAQRVLGENGVTCIAVAGIGPIVDARRFLVGDRPPRVAAWHDELEWDFAKSAQLARRFVGVHALSGRVLVVDGRLRELVVSRVDGDPVGPTGAWRDRLVAAGFVPAKKPW